MFDNIDKKKNRKNAIIGIILIAIPLFFYIKNKNVNFPNSKNIIKAEILLDDKVIKDISELKDLDILLKDLDSIHGKYLVLGNDPTKKILETKLTLDNNKSYVIYLRDATVEYNGHLYDINPDNYEMFIEKYSKN